MPSFIPRRKREMKLWSPTIEYPQDPIRKFRTCTGRGFPDHFWVSSPKLPHNFCHLWSMSCPFFTPPFFTKQLWPSASTGRQIFRSGLESSLTLALQGGDSRCKCVLVFRFGPKAWQVFTFHHMILRLEVDERASLATHKVAVEKRLSQPCLAFALFRLNKQPRTGERLSLLFLKTVCFISRVGYQASFSDESHFCLETRRWSLNSSLILDASTCERCPTRCPRRRCCPETRWPSP